LTQARQKSANAERSFTGAACLRKNTNSAESTSDQKAKHDEGDWNDEHDESSAERPNVGGDHDLERLVANVLCRGTFERSI
jgi:hypothetical protein